MDEQVKCFKTEEDTTEMNLPNGVTFSFEYEGNDYLILKQIDLLSSKALEEDDADIEDEYKRVAKQMENISKTLEKQGFISISLEEFKEVEQKNKKSKQNSFMSSFTEDEKFVYDETQKFFKEYDIGPIQRNFLSGLRKEIANGEAINELYLEVHAESMNKKLEKIFDFGTQSVVCDFIATTQKNLIDSKKSKKKLAI
jgi:hypothetical protein